MNVPVIDHISFVCTGNSCRSQMAEAILRSLRPELLVDSAGVEPANQLSHLTQEILQERGYDTSVHVPKAFQLIEDSSRHLVVCLCSYAFTKLPPLGENTLLLQHFVDDPYLVQGTLEQRKTVYEHTYDQIHEWISTVLVPML